MTLQQLIDKAQELIKQGVDPSTDVMVQDINESINHTTSFMRVMTVYVHPASAVVYLNKHEDLEERKVVVL